MGVEITQATSLDKKELEDFLAVVNGDEHKILAHDYVNAMFSQEYRRPTFLVAKQEGTLVGAAAYSEELFTTGVWGISWVSVREDQRNKGIGQALIEKCCEAIADQASKKVTVLLATYPDKTGLYDRTGFEPLGLDHEGGSFMKKTVQPAP